MSLLGLHDIGINWHHDFFLRYILQYEKIQEFSSDDLNSTLCYAALLLSCGQLTCTDLTSFCHTELCLCGTDVMWLVDAESACRVCVRYPWNWMSSFASYIAGPKMWLLRTCTSQWWCSNDISCSPSHRSELDTQIALLLVVKINIKWLHSVLTTE